MSYSAPPPPGGPAGQNPYQSPGATPNPYGGGVAPKKKDNTLWWILGIAGGVVLLCCLGVCGFFVFVGNEASDQYSSASSSASSSAQGLGGSGTTVSEGASVTAGNAAIQSGWAVSSDDDISGLMVRNDGTSGESFFLTFSFMKDGSEIADITCTTDYLDAGETDYSPSCISAFADIQDADEIKVKEGL